MAVVLVFNVADLSGRILGLRHVVLEKELEDIEFLLTRQKSLSVSQAAHAINDKFIILCMPDD